MAARARRRQGAAAGHRRPAADRGAAPGPDLLAGPRRRRAADRRRPRVRGLPRRPGPALRQAADDRGHPARRPPSSTSTRRRPTYTLEGTTLAGRDGLDRDAGPRPVPGHRRRRTARGRPTSTCAAAATSSTSARSIPRPASGPRRRSALFITVPFLGIEAPTLTVDQPAEGATFENGAIPVAGHDDECRRRSSVSADVRRPVRAARRPAAADASAAGRPGAGHGRRSPRTGRSARRSS